MRIKVSILIPVYNTAKWLHECIESCLGQKGNFDLEITLVDDHSTDGSWEILQSYKKKFPELINIFSNPQKGANLARNFAFEKSSGDYIQYLDSDDVLAEDKIFTQLQLLKDNSKNSIASCAWATFENIEQPNDENQLINKKYKYPLEWLIDSWMGLGMGLNSMWLCSREIIQQAGIWNESLLVNQDGEFFSRILMQASSIEYVNETLVYYRRGNAKSVSQKKSTEAKVRSLLHTYQLYVVNVQAQINYPKLKEALAYNFYSFIYQYDRNYPQLSKMAWKEIKNLNSNITKFKGGKYFNFLSKVIGFKSAILLLRKLKFLS